LLAPSDYYLRISLAMHKVAIVLGILLARIGHGRRLHTALQELLNLDDESSQASEKSMAAFHLNPSLARGGRHIESGAFTPRTLARSSDTAISMNMFDRFSRLVKSNVNDLLGKIEDPEKMIEQAVGDMQQDLVKVRQAYAEVTASTKRMESQKNAADADAKKWYERAQLALSKGDESLAKEALQRRQQLMDKIQTLDSQLEAQQNSVQSLYSTMRELESKMTEARAKKEQLVARARTAKTQTEVSDMLSGIGGSSMAAFDRMADKVEKLEAEADVAKELALPAADASMEDKFAMLEGSTAVDDELARMKMALGPADPKVEALPAGQPSEVDAELIAMKKKLEQESKQEQPKQEQREEAKQEQ
jgi:phage shock protein A